MSSMTQLSMDIFSLAEKRLNWIDKRQDVLAQNVANVNTPGYTARDLQPFSTYLAAQQQAEASGAPLSSSATTPKKDKKVAGLTMDGNSISLDTELEKVADTDTAQQLAMDLYKKYETLFKTAIDKA
jgi:flagellar basal-body rod protein FlgB